MPSDAKKPAAAAAAAAAKPASSPVKNGYLILYNAVSAALWLTVMVRTVAATVNGGGYTSVYATTGEFCKWTQTLAGMEVLHSLLGTSSLICPSVCVSVRYIYAYTTRT